MKRKKHLFYRQWGFNGQDIDVYHVGGECCWVEVRNIESGRLVSKKRFGGKDSRKRSIAECDRIKELSNGK